MANGIVFDIKEFSLHDGPGLRTTVFLKGCPLACMWCHNPEGQSPQPQWMRSPTGDRLAGVEYTPADLARLLNRQKVILDANEGGVTFSGGEPLMQAEFLAEAIGLLDGLHVLLDTSGYGSGQNLRDLLPLVHLVYYDIKLADSSAHLRYTGCDNELILANLKVVSASGTPFVIRVPLVPGVTDTDENMAAVAELSQDLPGLVEVNLLPYNRAAGAKYAAAGRHFAPDYDESRPVNANVSFFHRFGIKVRVT